MICGLCKSNGSFIVCGYKSGYRMVRCPDCGMLQVAFRNEKEKREWESLYDPDAGYVETYQVEGYENFDTRFEHDKRIAWARLANIKEARSFTECHTGSLPPWLLDVGCSTGGFLAAAAEDGYSAYGIEPDRAAVTKAQDRLPESVKVDAVPLQEYTSSNRFDIITLFDVFEHFTDLQEMFAHLVGLLERLGMLVIELPDANSYGARTKGLDWKHVKPREHACYAGKEHINWLIDMFDMRLVLSIVPYPDRRTYYIVRGN